jgi:hypothetical protein
MIHKHNRLNQERGMALIVVLLALLLVSAIGLGMIYMSSTESSINGNYKDTQTAFFAMRAGLEEMRDRMRAQSLQPSPALTFPLIPPTTAAAASFPGVTANSIVYITNPGAGDNVDPKTFGNAFFDDEFCHEQFAAVGAPTPVGTPCNSGGAPPASSVAPYVASMSPNTGTASSLKYKWVRITLKQNGTIPNATVDSSQPAGSQVCWDANFLKERVASAMSGSATCTAAANAGYNTEPVYLITSMAITPLGSRRVGQYEAAAFNLVPPPGALQLDGPTPSFGTPHSANAAIDGTDQSGTPPAVPTSCTTNLGTQPAIGTDNAADAASVGGQIFRPVNFTGSVPPAPLPASPSVVPQSFPNWSTPASLNNLVQEMANVANVSPAGCGINGVGQVGGGCSGTYGTPANPQITFVNGDVTLNGGAGVLVVTGTLTINGVMQFDGLILVIGQGKVVINGGGNGTVYGEMFAAQTNSSTPPSFSQLPTLGSPSFTWNGGGKSAFYYNSCWAAVGNNLSYIVLASREEMY